MKLSTVIKKENIPVERSVKTAEYSKDEIVALIVADLYSRGLIVDECTFDIAWEYIPDGLDGRSTIGVKTKFNGALATIKERE